MFEIRFVVEGEQLVARRFEALADRVDDPSPAWPFVYRTFLALNRGAFASEGASSDAGSWPALAARTQADRVRKGFPAAHPILERTGRLKRSLTAEGDENAIYQASTNEMRASSAVPYFKYHQSRAPRKVIPRRAVISYTADQRSALLHPIRLYLTGHEPGAMRRGSIG